jgi:hypothetical protein
MSDDMKRAQQAIADSPMTGGTRFTEIMEGYFYVGDDIEDPVMASEVAKGNSSTAKFYLSVDAWDINTLIDKKSHSAMLTGTFSCEALSKDPFMVLRGEFQLFSKDRHAADTENLVYKFDMLSVYMPFSKLNIRLREKLSISKDIKLSITVLPTAARRRGKRPLRFTSSYRRRMVQLSVVVFLTSAPAISAMNCSLTRT